MVKVQSKSEGKNGKEKGDEKDKGKSSSGSVVDRTVPWLLWSLLEMGP